MKNLGYCYRKMESYEEALEIYAKLAEQQPGDIKNESLIGFCHLKLEHYDEALKHYFKIEYMEPDNTNVIRPIAWCYFATGVFDKSEKYYRKVFRQDPNYYDYVNYGHLKWATGDRKAAIEHYLLSISEYKKFTFKELQKTMDEDASLLVEQGIEKEEISLMMDYLRYRLK